MPKKNTLIILTLKQYCFLYALFAESLSDAEETSRKNARLFANTNFKELTICISSSTSHKYIALFIKKKLIVRTRRESRAEITGRGRPRRAFYRLTTKGEEVFEHNKKAYSLLSKDPIPD